MGRITPPQLSQARASGAFPSANDPLGWGIGPFTAALLAGNHAAFGVLAASWGWYTRVIGGGTITKLGLHVVVSSGNISVAVYGSTGSGRSVAPGARKATTGSIACPAVGYAEVDLGGSVVVEPGDWFMLSADNTTATFRCAQFGDGSGVYRGVGALQTAAFPATDPAEPNPPTADLGVVIVGVA